MKDRELKKIENKKYYNPQYHREYYVRKRDGIDRDKWNSMSREEKEQHLKRRTLKKEE